MTEDREQGASQMAAKSIDPEWAWQPFAPSANQPWDRRAAAHLYRRAGFGATLAELDAAIRQSPQVVADALLAGASPATLDAEHESLANTLLSTGEPRQLAAWWVYVLLQSKRPLLERMTLFWHSHFAVSAAKVTDAVLMLQHHQLLRRHALAGFRPLVQQAARDPAMLLYLDSATNRKGHPNENFARELMELYCLGEGHYSEQDVQELARCFTGWEIKQGKFRFNRFQHDSGAKRLLGKEGLFPEGQAIDWILDQPQTALFVVGKLYREFICDEPAPARELLEPLAQDFRDSGLQIGPVVRRMLSSQLFYSATARGRKVRSPVEFTMGLLRPLQGTVNAHQLAADLEQNGQGLFYPPNVKGWEGGRTWINSSTILGRANLASRLLKDEKTLWGGLKLDQYMANLGVDAPDRAIDLFQELLMAVPLAPERRARLIEARRSDTLTGQNLTGLLGALVAMPEFQLC
jgi:uncharacterized protein (DUF1800 family)